MKKGNKRFVMLGERNSKGRIVKNESFSIDDFLLQTIYTKKVHLTPNNISFGIFEIMFKPAKVKKKLENYISQSFLEFQRLYTQALNERIIEMIEYDSFGKKKK